MSTQPISTPPVQDTWFIINPSDQLLKALGKTHKDLTYENTDGSKLYKPASKETGFYCLEIPFQNLPDGLEEAYIERTTEYYKRTVLKSELEDSDHYDSVPDPAAVTPVKVSVVVTAEPAKPARKKKLAKKVVTSLTDEESARLSGFKKQELTMKFSKRINEHFEKLRSVSHVVLDELARTKSKGFQRPIIDRGKHLKMIFADLSPLEVQEFAEISLYVFHDCEVDAVIPMKHLSPKAHWTEVTA